VSRSVNGHERPLMARTAFGPSPLAVVVSRVNQAEITNTRSRGGATPAAGGSTTMAPCSCVSSRKRTSAGCGRRGPACAA
jgi:hypothetical protein